MNIYAVIHLYKYSYFHSFFCTLHKKRTKPYFISNKREKKQKSVDFSNE